ncbi:hypothetical protein I9P32_03625, partial [Campylobacter peloridis]|nr:hypothetical protein [Campylobacter peloridis]
GGFAGDANGMFRNITLENIKNFDVKVDFDFNLPPDFEWGTEWIYGVGGFAGSIFGFVDGITLKNVGDFNIVFQGNNRGWKKYNINIGGFAGYIVSGNFSNISLNNIKNINSTRNAEVSPKGNLVNTGGFAGYINSGDFFDISLNTIHNLSYIDNSIYSSLNEDFYSNIGGFAGYINSGDFRKISLNDIKNIQVVLNNVSGAYSNLGGFVGFIDTGLFRDISLNEIKNINANINIQEIDPSLEYGNGSYSNIGGFAGAVGEYYHGPNKPIFNSIILNNIENLKNNINHNEKSSGGGLVFRDINTGGFVGKTEYGEFKNIFLNKINYIYSISNFAQHDTMGLGGFSGYSKNSLFKNIFINHVNNINAKSFSGFISIGGFGGMANTNLYENIFLYGLGDISVNTKYKNKPVESYIGGFIGSGTRFDVQQHDINSRFSNIYVYFKPDAQIITTDKGKYYVGKFFAAHRNDGYIHNINFDNIYIYHKKGTLTNAIEDKIYWIQKTVTGKINIYEYIADELEQDFKEKENAILKPIISSPFNPNITKPSITDG